MINYNTQEAFKNVSLSACIRTQNEDWYLNTLLFYFDDI